MDDIRTTFARRLRELRTRAGLSQDALARAAEDLPRAYVSELEAGKKAASIETLARLARALGVEPAELLKGGRAARPPRKAPETAGQRLARRVAKLAEDASERKIRAFEVVARAYFRG